jgi:ABC-type branched-subunit amino acid transport system substrate-binding protein/tRNA A-37 threonylcarbamoyl transferase component Bud32
MRDTEQAIIKSLLLNSGNEMRSRYRILHQLGFGGFSRTYLAEDLNRFNERCVLKEFVPQLQETFARAKAQELFEREAAVLYRLQHPQIPQFRQLFRYQQQQEEHLFLVQDYIEGITYHALLNQRLEANNRFSEGEIKQLLTQVLPILEYIHSLGVIHRDISPDNLILRNQDELPVLIDFGCIKEVEIKTQFKLHTVATNASTPLIGTALGKAGYAPPEQVQRGIVYPHSDLYALAATAVVLLTGKTPQQLTNTDSYRWHWQSEVTLSPKLEWILSKMLSPYPSDRFGSAAEVSKTLQNTSITTNSQFTETPAAHAAQNLNQQNFKIKASFIANLLAKSLFFIPFTAVLILGGYLCLKVADLPDLDDAPVLSQANNSVEEAQLQNRFSQGEKILIPQTTTPAKEMAVAAFAQGNYHNAASLFATSLKTVANDPEALIYLNNARIGRAKSYSIAVSVPIGSDVNAAQEILRGVAQAQDRINQKAGINDIPLKVQIVNDDNNPEIAQQVAHHLSQNQAILGVVGHYASDVTLATAEVYEAAKLIAISPISTSIKSSNLSPYIFRTVPSDYVAARTLAQYMLENLQQNKVAIFYNSQSNYSESLKSEFTASVSLGGGEIVNTFDLADANFNASDRYKEAVNSGAEAIMLAANTSALDKALQVVQVNRQKLSLLAGDDVYTPKTLQIAGERGENMVLAIPWHIRNSPDNEFVLVAQKLWGGEVNWRSAMAYDAAQALTRAIAENPQPTRISVQQNLSNSNFSTAGATSRVHFLPSGDRSGKIQLVKMQPGSNKFGYEFLPINP